ncbi:uncharacterized protein LOC110710190 [Chenopodium quinoa]|uniref:MTD1 n=1 Tax=Chenopodium quinoa TaxID=63459 RepID=A0A803LYP3_CHEQI|nr:uncharacterized protein LOC110710190 [Chenopodium quinoa]
MSIALGNNRVEHISSGYLRRSNKMSPPYNLPSILDSGDRAAIRVVVKEEERENGFSDPCSSSSSIGMNSDDEEIDEENEVESKLNNTSFDSAVDALEQALPIRRGISNFYNGKSKSFASLADAACTSIKEITKPENAYSRKRKNLLAYNLLCDNGRTSLFKVGSGIGGGIAKRPTNSSRSTLALAVAMKNCESHADEDGPVTETNGRSEAKNTSPSSPLSPLPPAPWRSFSLADLQHCAVSASVVNSNLSSPLIGKRNKHDEVS